MSTLKWRNKSIMKYLDKFKLILRLPLTCIRGVFYKKPHVMNDWYTIKYIIDNKCSVARYGDGEFDLMCGIGIKFQNADRELKRRLLEISKSVQTNCLVCIPDVLQTKKELYNKLEKKDADWWHSFLRLTRGMWYKFFRSDLYGDTNISRFYMEVKNKERTSDYVELIKSIWNEKNIVFVEGEKSRLGVGNDLFDNAASIRRILCPSDNAFKRYDEIFSKVMELTKEDDLIICALGPTATVLSFDLSQNGRRALDLGHIDVEYEWFKMGAKEKVSIAGKDVSETNNALRDENKKVLDDVMAVIV